MSPVRMRVDANPPTPLLLPEKGGPVKLRVPGKGRLQHLEHVHRLRKENATIKPNLGKISSYSLAENPEKRRQRSWFAHNFVFRITGEKDLFLDEINILTSTLRKAVMDLYPDPVPEIISGHDKNGNSSMWPHLAIIPLPDVGHRYAEGRIMGFGFWLPENTPAELLDTFELTLSKLNLLTLGRSGVFNLKHVNADTLSGSPVGVRPWTYSGTSDTWASVSPVIFGKYPKKSHIGPGKNGGKIFEEICRMIGLPAPMEVRIGPVSVFRGAPKVSHYDFPERYKNNLKSHVVIKFDEPVKGPVFIGAGRFKGFGFCRPFQKGRN
jgi:CRISPR-associated protein Csb2